jgi:poly(3-hydroxyalkanoate) synthetase
MIFHTSLIDDTIKFLAQSKKATTIDTMKHIQTSHDISRASFFRIVNQLISRQLLAKQGKYIMLNATRMMEYLNLAESIKLSFTESPVLRELQVGEFQRIE